MPRECEEERARQLDAACNQHAFRSNQKQTEARLLDADAQPGHKREDPTERVHLRCSRQQPSKAVKLAWGNR